MKRHLRNAAYGTLDYIAYPAGMLLTARAMFHHLGAAQYGIWTVAGAAVSTGAILASGFGDAAIRLVAAAREKSDQIAVLAADRSAFTVHLLLGLLLALIAGSLAPAAAEHLVAADKQLLTTCLLTLRIACLLLFLRALEARCISTQRAFENYGRALGVSVFARCISIALACGLAIRGSSVASIYVLTAAIQALSLLLQMFALSRTLGWYCLLPSTSSSDLARILQQGRFTWIVAAASVIFAYSDRLVIGLSQGAGAVVTYALCVQLAQPIYGFAASGLHFFLPYLARLSQSVDIGEIRSIVYRAVTVNFALTMIMSTISLFFGAAFIAYVTGAPASEYLPLLVCIVLSFSLLSFSVTAGYALFAMGRARPVALTLSLGAIAMIAATIALRPLHRVRGLAVARLLYGAACVTLYIPLYRVLSSSESSMQTATPEAEVGRA